MRYDCLDLQPSQPEWRRCGRFFLLALGLHAAVLAYPLKLALGQFDLPPPSTIMVRLVEAVAPRPVEPARIQPPQPMPQHASPAPRPSHERPAPTPRPVLAMAPEQAAAPAAFSVPAPVSAPPAPNPAPAANPAAAAVSAARFDAAYLHNPRPSYPALSRRLGEEGKVMLKVRVSAEGLPLTVDLEKSSGFERLDEAARQVVGHWRFVAAKRGDETIEATVIVPIAFRLDN
jgi:periplasmic protein TonB